MELLTVYAARFTAQHPRARFTLLRLCSAPHFYPFMLGMDNRDSTSFTDCCGRTFEWKFVPKDMPYSEKSCHYNLAARFKPYQVFFRGGSAQSEGGFPGKPRRGEIERVAVRKDKVLVMGADEEECLKYTTAAIFCMQTKAWRVEVDLAESFGNVDLAFLEGLDPYWID